MKSFLAVQSPKLDERQARTLPSKDYLKNIPLASVEIPNLDAQMACGVRPRKYVAVGRSGKIVEASVKTGQAFHRRTESTGWVEGK
jgi:hypothetical protein